MTITQLDLAWEAINALGGKPDSNNEADIAYDAALSQALTEIEKLGGEDPAPKRFRIAANTNADLDTQLADVREAMKENAR